MTQAAALTDSLEPFVKLAHGAPTYSAAWLATLRREALDEFTRMGFPTTQLEEWRLTNVGPVLRTSFTHPGPRPTSRPHLAHAIGPMSLRGIDAHELVFVNGEFVPDLSSAKTEDIRVSPLSQAMQKHSELIALHLGHQAPTATDGFAALNAAGFRDGVFLHIPDQTTINKPVHLLFLTTGQREAVIIQPRILVLAGAGSSVTLVQSYAGTGDVPYLTNAVCEIYVGRQARVELVKLQREGPKAFHIGHDAIGQSEGSTFQSLVVNLGGILVRNNLALTFSEPGAEATLNGLTLSTGKQHVDNHTLLDHARENCPSHELYKSLLDGNSTGVFKGKILVRPGAQKTDAKQTSKTVLLSDDAVMSSQPQLEIYADDVKCTHGSTTGPLDDEQLFYLRSRGIETAQARALLTYAFARDVLLRTWHAGIRDYLEKLIAAELNRYLDQAS